MSPAKIARLKVINHSRIPDIDLNLNHVFFLPDVLHKSRIFLKIS